MCGFIFGCSICFIVVFECGYFLDDEFIFFVIVFDLLEIGGAWYLFRRLIIEEFMNGIEEDRVGFDGLGGWGDYFVILGHIFLK